MHIALKIFLILLLISLPLNTFLSSSIVPTIVHHSCKTVLSRELPHVFLSFVKLLHLPHPVTIFYLLPQFNPHQSSNSFLYSSSEYSKCFPNIFIFYIKACASHHLPFLTECLSLSVCHSSTVMQHKKGATDSLIAGAICIYQALP